MIYNSMEEIDENIRSLEKQRRSVGFHKTIGIYPYPLLFPCILSYKRTNYLRVAIGYIGWEMRKSYNKWALSGQPIYRTYQKIITPNPTNMSTYLQYM